MEILFQLVFILTTLTHQLIIIRGGTYGSYFILGVPRYSSATAEFHLVTMSHETFHVSCLIKKVEPPLYEDKVYPTDLYLTRNRVVVKSLDIALSEIYRSIVFENPKYEYDFAVTVLIIDKRTGYWIDSMLALPVTSFNTLFYLPWFGNYARQLLVMSASTYVYNFITLYLYNKNNGYYESTDKKEPRREEFATFDFGSCGNDSYLKDDDDGGAFLASQGAFGVIIVTCENNFHFNCELEKTNYPFIESGYYVDYDNNIPMEFVVFSRITMAKMESTTLHDELIIAVVWALNTKIVINGEQTLYLKNSESRKIVLDFDYPLHIKTDSRVSCYYIGRGKDCTSSMALAWLVPVQLFYFSYAFSVPLPSNSSVGPMRIFLIMIAEKDTYSDILVDDVRALSYKAIVSDVSTTTYQVRYLQISPGWHSAYSTNHDNFGLYLYGWKDGGTFLHTVGYVVKDESCKFDNFAMAYRPIKPGDRLDNDCDKRVDEDLPGEDQDGDNKIGEDISRGREEDGGWGEWSEFICLGCEETFSKRSRLCENPAPEYEGMRCMGYEEESNNEKCRVCRMTPCPFGKYGRYCENTCGHCAGACNLITGKCLSCLDGWTGEKCTTPCPEMTYGLACKHSCFEKCNGRDCIERVQGICPAIYDVGLSAVVYYIFLVLLLGTLYGFCMSRLHLEKKPDVVVTVKRVSSKEYTVTEQIMTDK
ncbi:uncharacterized protein LOC131949061 isoform X2 [Physella acuta]|uniref:uncharacterized protein LOC131949061 isoform X2 n=1 Tax=Physella acuta TaxID=109671 RepID=UPI0027DDD558|nr:uncharacterized protein LOC131949061 isoform X2 [Physella acuta]